MGPPARLLVKQTQRHRRTSCSPAAPARPYAARRSGPVSHAASTKQSRNQVPVISGRTPVPISIAYKSGLYNHGQITSFAGYFSRPPSESTA